MLDIAHSRGDGNNDRRISLSVSDIAQVVSAAATLGLLIVAIIGVVNSRKRPSAMPKAATRPSGRGDDARGSFRWIPWVLVVVALASTAINWRISQNGPTEEPKRSLGADNAKVAISKIEERVDDNKKLFVVNYFTKNDRKADAYHEKHLGLTTVAVGRLDDNAVDGVMLYLQILITNDKSPSNTVLEAGQDNVFFSVPDETNQMQQYYEPWANNDHTMIYSLAIIQYTDNETEKNHEHIYTETCV